MDTLNRSEIIRSLEIMLSALDFDNPDKRPTFSKEEIKKEQAKAREALRIVINLMNNA